MRQPLSFVLLPVAALSILLVGMAVGRSIEQAQARPLLPAGPEAVGHPIAGSELSITIDSRQDEPVKYRAAYDPSAEPLTQWRMRRLTLSFQSEAQAKAASDRVSALTRELAAGR